MGLIFFYRKECKDREDRKGNALFQCSASASFLRKRFSSLNELQSSFYFYKKIKKTFICSVSTNTIPFAVFATFALFALKF
jgi:hypothetical protein